MVVVATGFENDCFDSTLNKEPIRISIDEEDEKKSDEDGPVVIDFGNPKDKETEKIIDVIYGGGKSAGGRRVTTRDLADPVCLPLDKLTEEELANIEQRPHTSVAVAVLNDNVLNNNYISNHYELYRKDYGRH